MTTQQHDTEHVQTQVVNTMWRTCSVSVIVAQLTSVLVCTSLYLSSTDTSTQRTMTDTSVAKRLRR